MRRPFQVVVPRKESFIVSAMDSVYEFRQDLRWRRLQRLCFWALRRIGAYKLIHTPHHVPIEPHRFASVYEMIRQCKDHHRKPVAVLIGPDDLRELIDNSYSDAAWEYVRQLPDQLLGVPVVIAPWVKGVAVVPEWR